MIAWVGAAFAGVVGIAVEVDGGRCMLTEGEQVAGGVAGPDSALVKWAAPLGPGAVPAGSLAPCAGIPPIFDAKVPATGGVVGLKRPATGQQGPSTALPLGEDRRYWWVDPGADAQPWIAFEHAEGPPTRLRLQPGPPVAVQAAPLPQGSVLFVPLAAGGDAVVTGAAEAVRLPDGVAILATGKGTATGAVRAGEEPPRELAFAVGGPLSSVPDELWVTAGQQLRRRVVPPVAAAHSGDPATVTVEVKKGQLILTGKAPGRAQIAVVDEAGRTHVLTVAVGS